ncbi:MAG: DPP IV N-terminal domain-containing protein, partial [Shewanella sp.]
MTKNGLASSLRAVKLGASSLLIASQLAMISSLTTASAYALEGGMTPLTIERMNASPALAGTSPRGLKLSPDGQRVTYLAGRKDNQNFYDLWQMDVKTGKSSLLLNADKLASNELSDEEKARRERQRIYGEGIMEYFWADDSKALLIPAAGNLYYFSLADNSVSLLPIGEGFATDARLSPKGNFVSFVRDQNLYVLDLATKKLEAMTTDGGGAIKNAMAEFVAQEEMDRMTGYWWAPDESAIAFTRIDESGVELVTRNEIYADGIKLTEQRYPAAGKNNVEIQLGVVTLNNKAINWVTLSDDKNKDIYLPRVDWLPDSKHLSFQWQSRDQQKLDLQLVALDALTKPKTLVKERSEAWVNLNNDLHFLKQQSAFIWASERDGFNHLYLFDLKGKLKAQLTEGNWAVDELEYIDETAGWVYFTGRKDTPIEKHLYRVPLAGGKIERVSREAGMHDPVFADNQSVYLDYFNSLSQPPQISLHGDKGQHLAWVEQNQV